MMQRNELVSEECRLTAMGLRLRHAREALQISESSAASQLFLSVEQIQALEDARYDQLPAEVFVRGYLRSYARLLGLDPEDILRQYNPAGTGASLSAVDGGRQSGNSVASSAHGGSAVRAKASASATDKARPSVAGKLAQISDTTLMVLSGVAILLVIVTVAALLFFGAVKDRELASAEQRDLAGEALVVDPQLFKVMDDATQLRIEPPNAGGQVAADSGMAASSVQGAQQRLEIEFTADCWVEVKDSSRNILLADMRRAGDREVFDGEPPYKVLLGRADAVTIRFGGKPFAVVADDGKDYTRVVIGGRP